ncbi:2-oxoglutarate dehydrogenase complex dihydrolipoyllysine-residue succinyltransferase [Pelomicrobium sp.]|jgi:2-oxoglutarate dehydrogenase E2 component (dihydrolipoamide succinyltransferase)|uniref:2-oxoglutarate dehydrogenase complex dihydrolipoyllysine-residue succinyltransferase n=1 Tax=Pelomicrobium sp. TaxID=2815319 RepID=UPI002FDCBB2B
MLIEVKVPTFSESVSEGTLLAWHKKPGEYVQRDENLIDIETDKVVLELPAPAAGVLTQILKRDGDKVVSDEVIATIDTEAKPPAGRAQAPVEAEASAKVETPAKEEKAEAASAVQAVGAAQAAAGGRAEALVMPAAKRLLEERGLQPQDVPGSGRGGRITKADVLGFTGRPTEPASGVSPAPATKPAMPEPTPVSVETLLAGRPEQRVPMSRLRARIAERLVQSQRTAAMLTTFNEVNMQAVIDLRNRYKDKFEKEHGVRLGFMSFFVKACVYALKKFPVVNASIDGNDIVYHGYYDIGIAVASPRGLVVPIIRNADQLSLAEVEKTISDFGKRAQEGKLAIEELTGGTFSISNGGVFGSMLSTPIINPPQSAILGIHATKDRPVVENGQIVIRPMNYLALSYDHRLIDGREAVLTLVAIKEALEDPARLLLEV